MGNPTELECVRESFLFLVPEYVTPIAADGRNVAVFCTFNIWVSLVSTFCSAFYYNYNQLLISYLLYFPYWTLADTVPDTRSGPRKQTLRRILGLICFELRTELFVNEKCHNIHRFLDLMLW